MSGARIELYRGKVNSPLLKYASDVTSQCGEDGIIAHICDVIEPANRVCIEFGAWDGKLFSNCYNLITNAGWDGVMIEANSDKYKELQATYAGNRRVKMLNRLVDFEGANTLDNILKEVGAPQEPGVLSIDIDGNDYHIFESLVDHWPDLVIVEFNPTVPNDVSFVQERSFDVNHGCSLLALVLLARQKDYELAVATAWNAFFVRNDKYALLNIADNSVSALYAPLQDGRIFQGYDSSIHVVGMDRLMWKGGIALTSADFQVLPESVRVWGDAQKRKE